MPRKTKELNELEKDKKETKKTTSTAKKTAKKSTTTKKTTTTEKSSTKKATATKKTTTKKTTTMKKTTKKADTKKAATTKSTAKKSTATKKVAPKKTTTKKTVATTKKKTTTKKSPAKKVETKKAVSKKVEIVEYYDLPYRYNQTIVKVLAQTPTNLFVYWDISDNDRKAFEERYGENFFETTRPVLIVHNNTKGYSFEVEINDFANSWYLRVSDSKCDYKIELGRRPIYKTERLTDDYIYVSTSNEIESPNDRILFDSVGDRVFFRDVKTGFESEKSIYNLSLLRNMGKIYNIYDLYKALYSNENVEDIYDLYNPSSSSSSF